MPSTGKRPSSGSASAGAATLASPARIFAGFVAIAFSLLWVSPQDARPLQSGVRWALNPGVRVVEWTERQTTKLVQYTRRELPASDTLGRNRSSQAEVLR